MRHAVTGSPPAVAVGGFKDGVLNDRIDASRHAMSRGATPNVLLVGVLQARGLRVTTCHHVLVI